MILVSLLYDHLLVVLLIPLVGEVLRILLAYLLARPSDKYLALLEEHKSITKQIAAVKSIQLEFVKHSLLMRQNIKIEKEVEAIKEEQVPKSKMIKTVLQVLRTITYIGLGIYLSREYGTLLVVDGKIFSPFIGSGQLVDVTALYIIVGGAIAWRHLLRTLLNIYVSNPAIIP